MSLADDDRTLDQLVQMAAESSEYPNADEAYATDEVRRVASDFDDAVYEALEEMVEKYPPKGGATAEDIYDGDASYLILITLEEAGAGIWDGSWDEYYDDTKPVEKFLKSKLGKWSDGTGAGRLEDAFQNAAYETAGGDDDEEEEDDEEYEENARYGYYQGSSRIPAGDVVGVLSYRDGRVAYEVQTAGTQSGLPSYQLVGKPMTEKDYEEAPKMSNPGFFYRTRTWKTKKAALAAAKKLGEPVRSTHAR